MSGNSDSAMAAPAFEEAPPVAVPFYAALALLMVEWNHAEGHMWHLLAAIAGQSLDDGQASAVKHATAYFETIRTWRDCAARDIARLVPSGDLVAPMIFTRRCG